MLDLTKVYEIALAYGAPGIIIAVLLGVIRHLYVQISKLQADRLEDMRGIAVEMKTAFATAIEVIRSHTAAQEKAIASSERLSESSQRSTLAIERLEERINDLDRGRRS